MTPVTLNAFSQALLDVTGFMSNVDTAQTVRQINPVLNISCTQIICATEPFDYVLPMNVIWLCMDKRSDFYLKLMQRVSKAPSTKFQHTWQQVTNINAVWAPQYYDPSDTEAGSGLDKATTDSHGIAKLTTEPASVGRPTFVSTTDPRNTDARIPTPHAEMHPEKPLVRVRTASGSVLMDAPVGANGTTFVADSDINASYGKIAASDLLEDQ